MRHQKKRHKLGRTAAHREATLSALASALIEHKRIETTLAKAKALRVYVEPIITRSKEDTTHNRREAFRHLSNKEAVKELFSEISTKVGDRPGGYTRIVKLGQRQGDSAEMAVIELVDWNDVRPDGAGGTKRRTRRSTGRTRRKPSDAQVAQPAAEKPASEKPAAAPAAPAAPSPSGGTSTGPEGGEATDPAAKGESMQMHDAPSVPANPEENEHPDHPQGASPGTGEPAPEFGKGDQGVAGGSRHRG
jgi:large subunit ribosomal protein L17